jgi:cytochrome b involved in lipid metabolism
MNALYKYIFPLLTIIIVGLIGFLVYTFAVGNDDTVNDNTETQDNSDTQDTTDTSTDNTSTDTEIETDPVPNTATFTREQVAEANTIANCLFIYENSVYAIPSSWANEHPGGRTEITSNCGKDVTQLFNMNHRGKTQPQEQLQEFYAGELSN